MHRLCCIPLQGDEIHLVLIEMFTNRLHHSDKCHFSAYFVEYLFALALISDRLDSLVQTAKASNYLSALAKIPN